MLMLVKLPIELLWIVYYLLSAIGAALLRCKALHAEADVLINAPRGDVWRFLSADRSRFDGPPVIETLREPISEAPGVTVTRVWVAGQETGRVVTREIERDEAKGRLTSQGVPHELWMPPEAANDGISGVVIDGTSGGTALRMFYDLEPKSFKERFTYPLAMRWHAARVKRQCEKEFGVPNRFAAFADHGIVLSILALASFWYLFGWEDAILLSIVILLHELGHAAAMRMVGIPVQGIYLVPFFGGAAVPKTAYRSHAHLGFVALMGPGFSLIPTLGLAALFWWTGDARLLNAIIMFAIINAVNLLPIYPLDGGQILNALLGSFSHRLARVASWLGVLSGLAIAVWLESFLIGVPFLLFALQRYLGGGRIIELKPLSVAGAVVLVLAFIATFALHAGAVYYADLMKQAIADNAPKHRQADKVGVPVRCDLPADSAGILKRYLRETDATGGAILVHTLALADRAGHGDVLRSWDARPEMLKEGTQNSRTLLLARSASVPQIAAELAKVTDQLAALDFHAEMTAGLLAFDRREDAFALFPAGGTATDKMNWFYNLFALLDSTVMLRDALALLERIGLQLERPVNDDLLAGLGWYTVALPLSAEDKASLLNRLASDLDAVAKDRAGVLSEAGRRAVLIRLGGPTPQTLDPYYAELASLPYLFGAIAAGWMDRGETGKLDDLRRRVDEAFAPKPSVLTQDGAASQVDYSRDEWQNYFETYAATTRLAWRLDRHDVAAAETLIVETRQRMWGSVESNMTEMVSRYYLAAGDWEQAEAWHRRLNASAGNEGYSYQIRRAIAALRRARNDIAKPAFDTAATMVCKQSSIYGRHTWTEFLRTAYLIKAVEEGRLPPQILGNLTASLY